jgi:5,10-methylenetetrahydromethanopterin reductase
MKLSLASLGAEPGARFLEQVKLAELLGFNGYCHDDKRSARELFSRLGAATQVTTRLGLAAGVIDPTTRHPALIAQAAATLAELAPRRVRVILGAGSDFETLPGQGRHDPLAALREAAELMRRLWRGETVTLDGEVVKFRDGALDWKPAAVPPLHIAGREPQILELAGSIADGVLIESFATLPGIEYAKRQILAGLQGAGRDWPDIALGSCLHVCVQEREGDPTPEEIKRAVSVAVWSIRKVLGEIIDQLAPYASYEFKAFVRDAPAEASAPVMDELRRLLPPTVVGCLAVVGTAPQLVDRLKALAAAGMQEVVLSVVPAPGQDMIDVMYKLAQEVLPHFSERATRPS